MRFIWRGLFWLGDGGWAQQQQQQLMNNTLSQVAMQDPVTTLNANSSGDLVHGNLTTDTSFFGGAPQISFKLPMLHSYNNSFNAAPITFTIVKALFDQMAWIFNDSGKNSSDVENTVFKSAPQWERESLLSSVTFLTHLTAQPKLNKLIVDILEGQIITLFVVVAFVLVFLIREWVVQQQPIIQGALMGPDGEIRREEQDRLAQIGGPAVAQGEPQLEDIDQAEYPEVPSSQEAGVVQDRPVDSDDNGAHESLDPNGDPCDEARGEAVNTPLRPRTPLDTPEIVLNEMPLELTNESGPSSDVGQLSEALNVLEDLTTSGTRHSVIGNTAEDISQSIEGSRFEDGSTNTLGEYNAPQSEDTLEAPLENSEAAMNEIVYPSDTNIEVQHPRSIGERLSDWIFGDLAAIESPLQQDQDQDDERIVEDAAAEEPFVPFADGQLHRHDAIGPIEDEAQDPEVVAAAAEAGIDPNDAEAIEDMEELEGVMELIGMQGPLIGLFQNAVFSAVLISATVSVMVWIPYLWGKVVLLFLAHPIQFAVKAPVQIVSSTSNFVIDGCIFFLASVVEWFGFALWILAGIVVGFGSQDIVGFFGWLNDYCHDVAKSAILRMAETMRLVGVEADSDYLHLSVRAHEALRILESHISAFSSLVIESIQNICTLGHSTPLDVLVKQTLFYIWQLLIQFFKLAGQMLLDVQSVFTQVIRSGNLTLNLDGGITSGPPSFDLIQWSATDRLVAILTGYAFFAFAGALYLRRGAPITSSQHGRKVEGALTEMLQQAGGVLKVILIISIEMLVFPLYCGLLLDVAMLPLFTDSTIASRVSFTVNSPWTSCFVHWFIGTCYMFHFALFVSMCRKILRSGVLYFIRDPDDPTFHPVRDVLERSVATQLRKIGFSALVYGGLVMLCLGSVVWSIYYLVDGILPIDWLSNKPIVAFPIDLLLYNFLTPLIIHMLKPSQGLQVIYDWWFRECARYLRLSHFLFGKDEADEIHRIEGTASGRFVRVPASDSVRILKNSSVFLEVTEDNTRIDGKPELDTGVHGRENDLYIKLYIPPWFRIRIGLFVFCLWALTAAVGLGVTVLPLTLGRLVLSTIISNSIEMSDIYAYASGMCVLGVASYLISWRQLIAEELTTVINSRFRSRAEMIQDLSVVSKNILVATYTYTALIIIIPTLLAAILELYLVMPLHAYLHGVSEPYTMYFLQDWTLGVLYLRIGVRFITAYPDSRTARALRAIIEKGWLTPNARLATRAFILPSCVVAGMALVAPLPFAWFAQRYSFAADNDVASKIAQRFAYPVLLAAGLGFYILSLVVRVACKWRRRIRDEVYLIGERLHNYGEKRQQQVTTASGAHLVGVGRRL